ncbi:cytidine deaminase [Jiangella anatolica]|uniref:Cytidine deaminase n=1 Tax=Jiangella anatolica TaxID=2670374 RepID=A0A2W2C1V3_9ACTN|nr:cytidine deaminase [Jiangella anatolica]PZF82159.1 cytidine deaminase [Jiangella anatolica]
MSRPPLARPPEMGDDDAALMAAAAALLDRVYVAGRHEVVAAMRLADGSVQLGVHVDGSARRSAVCAEGVAAGNVVAYAATSGAAPSVLSSVSVLRRPGGTEHVIEPCGVCAELLSDYWPRARVWVTRGDDTVAVTAADLLPAKRLRQW